MIRNRVPDPDRFPFWPHKEAYPLWAVWFQMFCVVVAIIGIFLINPQLSHLNPFGLGCVIMGILLAIFHVLMCWRESMNARNK